MCLMPTFKLKQQGRFKWSAWDELGDMPQDAAADEYIQLVDTLQKRAAGDEPVETTTAGATTAPAPSMDEASEESIVVTSSSGVLALRFNKLRKKNAISMEMVSVVSV